MSNYLSISSLRCEPASDRVLREHYLKGRGKTFVTDAQMLFNQTDEDVNQPGTTLAVLMKDGEAIAGGLGVIDGGQNLYVAGCFVDHAHRGQGLIRPVIATLRIDAFEKQGVVRSKLVVRIQNGKDNEPAIRAYGRLGYEPSGIQQTPVQPDDPTASHLILDEGLLTVRTMTADASSLPLCRAILKSFQGGEYELA